MFFVHSIVAYRYQNKLKLFDDFRFDRAKADAEPETNSKNVSGADSGIKIPGNEHP